MGDYPMITDIDRTGGVKAICRPGNPICQLDNKKQDKMFWVELKFREPAAPGAVFPHTAL